MFGLDSRALRIIWTLAFCYLLYLLRGTILLVVLSLIRAYLLLPVVDFIYSKLTQLSLHNAKRH
jgi:predicted PurR-regulated permease PerM